MALSTAKKERIRERDSNMCARCREGRFLRSRHLCVHHIIPKEHGGTDDEENLITLCRDCHRWAHKLKQTGQWRGAYRDVRDYGIYPDPVKRYEHERQYAENY
jgi:5-methylcytosine-specific restriction endonuclease McrA